MLSEQTLQRLDRLTPKERACLQLVARRLSSKQIAAELGIAKTSVDTYCNRARSKLGVGDRYEAARLVAAQAASAAAPVEPDAPAVPASRPRAERAVEEPPSNTSRRVIFTLVAVLVVILALASLISGVDALTDMRHQQGLATLRHAAAPPRAGGRGS